MFPYAESGMALLILLLAFGGANARSSAVIDIDASKVTGTVSPYFFGQFIEHEHNTIQGGLWAELLHDRKFEQGDNDQDGVSNGWVPEERVQDSYWKVATGIASGSRYYIDRQDYYGGGASQAIHLRSSNLARASVYQIALHLAKGARYTFYVYLKAEGNGRAFVELDRLRGPVFGRREFDMLSSGWRRYEAEFISTEETHVGRLRIGFEGIGAFHIDSASLMPTDNLRGMRRDVVEALRPMRIPLMRYPGGCFADYYHWENGIGDRDKRPEIFGPAWQEWDPNDFGIDEFMDFARELGFEPHLTTNYVSGTPAEAARWVEYMNGDSKTKMGRRRAVNGHAHPYAANFWAVGNEAPSLCSEQYTGGTALNVYVRRYTEYRSAMQAVDPSIRLMASSVGDLKWIHDLINAMPVQILAISIYTGEAFLHPDDIRICDLDHYYRHVVAEPLEVDRKIEQNIRSLGSRLPRDSRFFAISEINSWWLSERVDPDYRLANALYFAGVFNVFLRRANEILTTEASTTLNVQGLIGINPVAIKLTPPYFAYVLYANHIGPTVVHCVTHSPMTEFDSALPALDATATVSADGKTLFIAVINRAEKDHLDANVNLNGWTGTLGRTFRTFELNGQDRDAANPFGSAENVNIREKSIDPPAGPLVYKFPPHSITVLQFAK
jgi:alpha-N-arabinofuranosidase